MPLAFQRLSWLHILYDEDVNTPTLLPTSLPYFRPLLAVRQPLYGQCWYIYILFCDHNEAFCALSTVGWFRVPESETVLTLSWAVTGFSQSRARWCEEWTLSVVSISWTLDLSKGNVLGSKAKCLLLSHSQLFITTFPFSCCIFKILIDFLLSDCFLCCYCWWMKNNTPCSLYSEYLMYSVDWICFPFLLPLLLGKCLLGVLWFHIRFWMIFLSIAMQLSPGNLFSLDSWIATWFLIPHMLFIFK